MRHNAGHYCLVLSDWCHYNISAYLLAVSACVVTLNILTELIQGISGQGDPG